VVAISTLRFSCCATAPLTLSSLLPMLTLPPVQYYLFSKLTEDPAARVVGMVPPIGRPALMSGISRLSDSAGLRPPVASRQSALIALGRR
jgi:hypothetical protein